MSRRDERLQARDYSLWIALAAIVLLLVVAIARPEAAGRGWLVAFVVWSSAPIGALALSLIHKLTGGRWGDAIAPTLRLGIACLPVLPLFFLAMLPSLTALYPWASTPDAIAADVAKFYLNAPAFAARSMVALVGLAIIGFFVLKGRVAPLGAGLGLTFYGVVVSVTATDWTLSLAPRFTDSAFGAEMAAQQIMTALAFAAAMQPVQAIERSRGDLGALILAVSLGELYLKLMTFLVKWYGDQPDDATWYLRRSKGAEIALLVIAIGLSAAVPIASLSWERVRGSELGLRRVGVAVLAGVIVYDFWLLAPEAPWLVALVGLLALALMSGLSLGFAPHILRLSSGPSSRGASHER